jgi:hypothetical protein
MGGGIRFPLGELLIGELDPLPVSGLDPLPVSELEPAPPPQAMSRADRVAIKTILIRWIRSIRRNDEGMTIAGVAAAGLRHELFCKILSSVTVFHAVKLGEYLRQIYIISHTYALVSRFPAIGDRQTVRISFSEFGGRFIREGRGFKRSENRNWRELKKETGDIGDENQASGFSDQSY